MTQEKKAYSTPTLTTHGDMQALTQHMTDGSGSFRFPLFN
jgi:hypothetical protein